MPSTLTVHHIPHYLRSFSLFRQPPAFSHIHLELHSRWHQFLVSFLYISAVCFDLWLYHLLCTGSHSQAFSLLQQHPPPQYLLFSFLLAFEFPCLFVCTTCSVFDITDCSVLAFSPCALILTFFFYSPASSVLPLSPGQFLVMLTHQNVELLHFMRAQNRKCCSSWSMPKCCRTRGMHSRSLFH